MVRTATKRGDELCSPTKQCAGMRLALEATGRVGIQWAFLLDGKKGSVTNQLAYRPPGRGAKLMLLNNCPWCGRSLK